MLENAGTAATPSDGDLGKIDLAALRWFKEKRGISATTLAKLPVASGTAYFPDAGKKLPAVFFKYPHGWKVRSFPEKHFVSGDDLCRTFWNIERVLKAKPEIVYIVEGEPDVCALVEAGISETQVIGCHGAKDKKAAIPQPNFRMRITGEHDPANRISVFDHVVLGGPN